MGNRHDADPNREAERRRAIAWLTDVLERIVSGRTKIRDLHTLLPWNWQGRSDAAEYAIQRARAA